ncbi:MAG: DNA internalization-related competence protein ComEC/Rec2 [Fibrobacterota bacterium]
MRFAFSLFSSVSGFFGASLHYREYRNYTRYLYSLRLIPSVIFCSVFSEFVFRNPNAVYMPLSVIFVFIISYILYGYSRKLFRFGAGVFAVFFFLYAHNCLAIRSGAISFRRGDTLTVQRNAIKGKNSNYTDLSGKDKGNLRLFFKNGLSLRTGTKLILPSIPEKPFRRTNPGGFSYRNHLFLRGITATAYVEDINECSKCGEEKTIRIALKKFTDALREYIRKAIRDNVLPEYRFFAEGIILGNRAGMPERAKEDFSETGMFHILAVSGMHVAVILVIFNSLFSIFFMPVRLKAVFLIAVLWVYAIIAGFGPSVFRAAVMGSAILGGWLFQRRTNIYNTLAFSAVIILIVNPLFIYDPGFLLSYGATFGIIFLYRKFFIVYSAISSGFPPIIRPVLASFFMTFSALAGTAPFLMTFFGKISLVSFFANLAVVPLAFCAVSLCIALIAVSPILPFAASSYGAAFSLITKIILIIVEKAADFRYASFNTGAPGVAAVIFIYVFLTLALSSGKNLRKWALPIFILLSGLNLIIAKNIWAYFNPCVKVTFMDVGQGDAVLLELPGKNNILIDAGDRTRWKDYGERVVSDVLRYKGVNRLNYCIASHPDRDHIGGMASVIENFNIKALAEPDLKAGSTVHRELRALCISQKIPIVKLFSGCLFKAGSASLLCLSPPLVNGGFYGEDSNENSIIIRMVIGKNSLLLTGDAGFSAENFCLSNYGSDVRSNILKIGHHGSGGSTGEKFINAVSPSECVISVGKNNRFGHPDNSVIQRVADGGRTLHRTDRDGAVEFLIYKDTYKVRHYGEL